MRTSVFPIGRRRLRLISLNTLIVGSGAAALNAAVSLHALGQTDIAVATEGLGLGTSFNTGSDKQTYYKISLAAQDGGAPDGNCDEDRRAGGQTPAVRSKGRDHRPIVGVPPNSNLKAAATR